MTDSLAESRRNNPPEDYAPVRDVPFIRITPNKLQVSLGRDFLTALGWPAFIRWFEMDPLPGGQSVVRIVRGTQLEHDAYMKNRKDKSKATYAVTYCGQRSTALTTLPVDCRSMFNKGKYYGARWDEKENWVEILPAVPVPKILASMEGSAQEGETDE